jgi:prepilin-type N-terminal cleavage/methylation domain-containing protein
MPIFEQRKSSHVSRQSGFTLIELVLVITIISIVVAVGSRYTRYAVDAKKFKATIEKLTTIKRALVGDERLVVLGNRADMGYFENNYSFPAPENVDEVPTTALRPYLPPVPELDTLSQCESYKRDAWDQLIDYQVSVNRAALDGAVSYDYVQIIAYGANGPGPGTTVFDEDIEILIRRDLFTENFFIANIMDNNGVILRGCPNRVFGSIDGSPGRHQIFRMRLENAAGTVQYGTDQAGASRIYYYQGIFSSRDDSGNVASHPIPAGFYRMHVWPTDGTGNSGNWPPGVRDHRDDLSGANVDIALPIVIYPKDPLSVNAIEFRLPGEVDTGEL